MGGEIRRCEKCRWPASDVGSLVDQREEWGREMLSAASSPVDCHWRVKP